MPKFVSRLTVLSTVVLCVFLVGRVPAADLPEIHGRGVLEAAARPVSTLIYSPTHSELPGFCYELAEEFARSLDVEIDVQPVDSFRAYWQRGSDQSRLSLFDEVDLYAEILTVTPERRELLSMTPYVENTEILVGRAGSTATELRDLRGMRVAVVEGMSFQHVLEDALSHHGVSYSRVPAMLRDGGVVPRDHGAEAEAGQNGAADRVELLLLPSGMRTTLMFFPEQLAKGSVDFFILDSFSLFHQLNVSQAMRTMVRPLFPVNDKVGELAFGTSLATPELNRALHRWMQAFRTTDAYDTLVERYLGMPYDRYRAFIEDFPE